VAALLLLLAVNLAGTADAVAISIREGTGEAGAAPYTISPPPDTPPAEVGSVISVTFEQDMAAREVTVRRRSIWYQQEPVPRVDYNWRSPRELAVLLSRPLQAGEALLLELDVYRDGPRGVPLPVPVDIAYQADS
jgi:hypothetical protein